MLEHLLQHASGVDQDLCIIKECRSGIVNRLNLDFPAAFVRFPPSARHQMAELDVGVELVLCHDRFEISENLAMGCIAVVTSEYRQRSCRGKLKSRSWMTH